MVRGENMHGRSRLTVNPRIQREREEKDDDRELM